VTTLFISDLHLDAVRPDITALFLKFLETDARRAEKLYILGDFFEVWIGDDDPDPHHAEVMRGLRQLTDAGVPVDFMRGNRDFLIGADFAARTGVRLLQDPTVVDLCGRPTLLMHGDTLCTDDVEYQAMRRMFHDPRWQQATLAKPLEERRAFAKSARAESKSRTAAKAEYIMDVNHGAVEAVMREHGVQRLIHGHTHRPAVHRFQSGGKTMERVVLGDWYEQLSRLRWEPVGGRLDDPRVKDQDAAAD
jgi:UDP-2,3-diacylglucosamine hydrolase